MGNERDGDEAERRRADVYSSARIGAAAALTLVLVVLLVLDVVVPDYHVSPGILLPLLGAILALPGLKALAFWRTRYSRIQVALSRRRRSMRLSLRRSCLPARVNRLPN